MTNVDNLKKKTMDLFIELCQKFEKTNALATLVFLFI
jgi:hypothetical protein